MNEHPEILLAQTPHLTDEQLAAWTADELARDERGDAQRHLGACNRCQGALAETQRIRALVRATERGADHTTYMVTSVVGRVLAQLPQEKTSPLIPSPARGGAAIPSAIPGRHSQRRETWRRIGALAAVLLLIATSALLFTRFSGREPSVTSTLTPGPDPLANIPNTWAEVLPKNGVIADVSVVSPTDIWAVGGVRTPNASGSQDIVLLHFDGKHWRRSPESFPGAALFSVSMASSTDGWASGMMGIGQPFLLRYTNGHWRDARTLLDIAPLAHPDLTLTNVHVTGSAGWALGQFSRAPDNEPPSEIFQLTKKGALDTWEPFESLMGVRLTTLAVVSDHEAWVGGFAGKDAFIARLTTSTTPSGSVQWETHSWENLGRGVVTSISMRSSTDGWAAGNDENNAGVLFHWDGAQWSPKSFVKGNYKQAGIDGVVMTGENSGWVYSWDQGYLYSTADNQWFSYPLPDHEKVIVGAALTPTTFLAIVGSLDDPQNPVFIPRVYTMSQGTPVPAPTSITP